MSRDKKALADTVFLEARDQGRRGWEAVAHVIMNRARQNKSYFGGSTVAGVCYHPYQFSCWDGRDKNLDINEYGSRERQIYNEIKDTTDAIYSGYGAPDPTNGADHYHNPHKEPNNSWKDKCHFKVRIGDHDFYKAP